MGRLPSALLDVTIAGWSHTSTARSRPVRSCPRTACLTTIVLPAGDGEGACRRVAMPCVYKLRQSATRNSSGSSTIGLPHHHVTTPRTANQRERI